MATAGAMSVSLEPHWLLCCVHLDVLFSSWPFASHFTFSSSVFFSFLLLLGLGGPMNRMDQGEEEVTRRGSLILLCVSSREWLMLWEEPAPLIDCMTLGVPLLVLHSLFLSVKWVR